ncbi:MAG TPA: biotin--[acetyl-CoA-carboxylase] ligase [Blastocatellia bacterium]|nr:biotin--[acetyl-CoA-carboxylase] ligase [Blastocatellia bacterium]
MQFRTIHLPPFMIHHYSALGSTNDRLKELSDAPEFTCIVADEQRAGRGRNGRAWHSTPGAGLYLSILLCPKGASSRTPLLSLAAGICVAEVLAQDSIGGIDLKWPNDVLVHERKISGILIEGVSSGTQIHRLVMGIGVNLNAGSFPPELSQTATSLAIETGRHIAVDEFRNRLLKRIAEWYARWTAGEDQAILDRWQELSSYATGKQVLVTLGEAPLTGETAGLTETGALRVRTGDDQLKIVYAGEIMSLRTPGAAHGR